ncbi:MAG: DHH family phosphoesterase [Candidatus Komeilibacteria bacterium]|nr:DHH family phosphoesterase [Candidatus Komeilibacteria bacterium]
MKGISEKVQAAGEKLRKVLQERDPSTAIAILIAQLDPDALGSALAMQYLCAEYGQHALIYYGGAIGNDHNVHIFKVYNLHPDVRPVSQMSANIRDIILVDSGRLKDGRLPTIANMNPLAVIDHHRGSDIDPRETVVLIEDVGACATLITEMIKHLLGKEVKEIGGYVWGTLAIGIYTDTKELTSASDRDRKAFDYLIGRIGMPEFIRLLSYKRSLQFLENFSRALNHRKTVNTFMFAPLGKLGGEERGEDLPLVADFLVRTEGITLVLVWALVADNVVRISARSAPEAPFDLNELLREKFGQNAGAKIAPDGHGEGGARITLQLDEWLQNKANEAYLLQMVENKIEQLFI